MKLRRYWLFLLVPLMAFAAGNPLDRTIAQLKKYLEELPQEKAYLHFDRRYYAGGERIWFKAYLVAGPHHIPSTLSQTLYVELLDQKNRINQQIKLLIQNGSAAGDFLIPENIQSGNYTVRAYTQWMRNFDEGYFFHHQIKIMNPEAAPPTPTPVSTMDVQFLPEGGEWVGGFRSKLGFKAVGEDGLGRKIAGKIVDEAGNLMTRFESNFLGMGWCAFVPQKEKTYRAIIDEPRLEVALPKVLDSGITLAVTNAPGQNDVVVRIQTTRPDTVYLIAQTRGLLCFGSKIILRNPISFVKIPVNNFPTGLAQLTVLDKSASPRAERLIFIDQHEALSVVIRANKKTFAPREMVRLTIDVTDEDGNPLESNLSLAVTDQGQVPDDGNNDGIYSYFYLSSELKGNIESPGYYFNPSNRDRLEDLDILLLTQGWRRFQYSSLLEGWPEPAFGFEQGITLKGRLVEMDNGKPVVGGKVSYLSTFPSTIRIAQTSASGHFEIPGLFFFDSSHFMIEGETKKGGKSVKVIMDSVWTIPSHFQAVSLSTPGPDFEADFIRNSIERKQIDKSYTFDDKTIILDPVIVKGKAKDPESVSSIKRVYGPATAKIEVANNLLLENMQHPLQLIQGRVAGVQVTGSGNSWSVAVQGVGSILSGTQPLILMNNIPYDIDILSSFNVRDIESVQIYKGPDAAIFGARGANGVIAFYTKTGANTSYPSGGLYQFNYAGYYTPKEFYSPQYDIQRPEHVKPDQRMTLFWASNIRTDSTGKATVSFYNHDLVTTVRVVAEGISSTGLPGRSILEYPIEK